MKPESWCPTWRTATHRHRHTRLAYTPKAPWRTGPGRSNRGIGVRRGENARRWAGGAWWRAGRRRRDGLMSSLTSSQESNFTSLWVLPLADLCSVLLLLLGVTEITSQVSEFCSATQHIFFWRQSNFLSNISCNCYSKGVQGVRNIQTGRNSELRYDNLKTGCSIATE
jgi:hypothetical protein